ncbi:MAG: Gfo/Idh/MocA family oxidoreductase [Chloroflexi bacterium]|nr:Gfo/Idh/MocA family oxidoreductase [Chloroflexota bacterium]
MSERRFGVGIIGLGWVAEQHLQAWKGNPHCAVVALCSRDRAKAESWGTRFGLQSKAYTDPEDLVRDPAVDIVSICTINSQHASQAIAAAQAGKHVLIEKPIALTLDEMRRLESAITAAGVKSQVSFELHWSPFFQNVRALLEMGALGRVYYGEFDYFSGNQHKWYVGWDWVHTRSQGGSAFLAAGCHAVDALRQFMPGEPKVVTAFAGNFTKTFEYEPTISALVQFSSGAIAKVASVIEGNIPYTFNVRLHGVKGTIVQNRFVSELLPGQTGWAEIPTIMPDTPQVAHHPFQGEMNDLVDAILSGRPALVDIHDAVKTHELIFAAEQSAREGGKPITLPLP